MDGKDAALAIELTFADGQVGFLLSHWRLAEAARLQGKAIFDVQAKCGCRSDFTTFTSCEGHRGALTYRVVDATRPQGRRIPIR